MATASNIMEEAAECGVGDGNLLVLVIDVNPDQRVFLTKPVRRLTKWLDSGLALVNSHLLLHPSNHVAVVASSKSSCKFLYPDGLSNDVPKTEDRQQNEHSSDGQFEGFRDIEKTIRRRVQSMIVGELQSMNQTNQPLFTPDSLIAGGICMALSYINRKQKDLELPTIPNNASEENSGNKAKALSQTAPSSRNLQARILVMTASGSAATQYMNYMNAFFTAQVSNVGSLGFKTG